MTMTVREGWQGRVYEDFTPGDVYPHPLGRTVTQADNIWFTLLTVNTNPIHFDAVYAAQTEWGRPLVDSTFTLALVTGLSVADISQNAVNLGWDAVRLLVSWSRIEPGPELVILQTFKGERFYFPPDQLVGLRFGGPESRNKGGGHSAGFR